MKLVKSATARILKEVQHYERMYHKGAQERSWECSLWGEGDLRLKMESWEELGALEEQSTEAPECSEGAASEKWERNHIIHSFLHYPYLLNSPAKKKKKKIN